MFSLCSPPSTSPHLHLCECSSTTATSAWAPCPGPASSSISVTHRAQQLLFVVIELRTIVCHRRIFFRFFILSSWFFIFHRRSTPHLTTHPHNSGASTPLCRTHLEKRNSVSQFPKQSDLVTSFSLQQAATTCPCAFVKDSLDTTKRLDERTLSRDSTLSIHVTHSQTNTISL